MKFLTKHRWKVWYLGAILWLTGEVAPHPINMYLFSGTILLGVFFLFLVYWDFRLFIKEEQTRTQELYEQFFDH